jgi:hypothetical protein
VPNFHPPLATLDLISAKLHRASRPMDFAGVLVLDAEPELLDRLEAGALSACAAFPASGSAVEGRHWARQEASPFARRTVSVSNVKAESEAFIDAPNEPHEGMQVRQLLLEPEDGSSPRLLTRFHHCAFDGTAAALWLFHQLMVAQGAMDPFDGEGHCRPPEIKQHNDGIRKMAAAPWGASRRLWSSGRRPSSARRWTSVTVDAVAVRAAAERISDATMNDVLALHCLETMKEWNRVHGRSATRMGLWLPMNIRVNPFDGFGNGSSRIRVYGDPIDSDDAADRVVQFRQQVLLSRVKGEWSIPDASGLMSLPDWLLGPVMRAYLGRPWVDMGSAPFTHMERHGAAERLIPMIRSSEWVLMLHRRHPLGLVAATLGDSIGVTLTHDPAMISESEAANFLAMFHDSLRAGCMEITG